MLDLSDLAQGFPAITPAFGQYLAEAGAVCLESQGHPKGKDLRVQGDHTKQFSLQWPSVTEQMQSCLNDTEVATEHGAVGIAALLVKKVIGYSLVQRSRRGTGFDYWLGEQTRIPFQNKARLEVSGIRQGTDSAVKQRVKTKLRQTDPSDKMGLPAYIVVIEFGKPLADMRSK